MENTSIEIRNLLADKFQSLADKDTHFRFTHAPMVGDFIANSEPGWDVARATAALVLTDATDGFWARTAKTVRGEDIATEGGALDPAADHLTVDSIMSGLMNRESKRGNEMVARRIAQLRYRSHTRNQRMDENRAKIASRTDIDQKELRASILNKSKMVFQVLGGIALTSPLSDRRSTRGIGLGLMQFGTWVGELGERQFRSKVDHLTAEQLKKCSTPKPKHLKDRF